MTETPCKDCGGAGGATGCGEGTGHDGPCHCGPYAGADTRPLTLAKVYAEARRRLGSRGRVSISVSVWDDWTEWQAGYSTLSHYEIVATARTARGLLDALRDKAGLPESVEVE